MPETALEFDPRDVEALAEPHVLLGTDGTPVVVAPNRIVYQPMEAGDAEPDGSPGARTLDRYRARAAGRAGIDFIEAVAVSTEAQARGSQLVLTERTRDGFARLVDAYRSVNPDTPLVMQLTHSGRFARGSRHALPPPGRRGATPRRRRPGANPGRPGSCDATRRGGRG